MLCGFDTESVKHAEAALLLYAMYRSRDKNSSLNGMETWDRCAGYIRAAIIQSSNIAEFVNNFCRKAKIQSIKPGCLKTTGIVKIDDDGTLIEKDGVYDYQTYLFEKNELLNIFTNESMYVIMLVRERIQREKEGLGDLIETESI